MPRGKKESNRPPAGGITRNDHHRRNRRRNISMHCHSHGVIRPLDQKVRVVKRLDRSLTSQHVQDFNERERVAFDLDGERGDYDERDEIPMFFEALSSLEQSRYMYLPPFLNPEQIKQRRFGTNANDRWWDWEEELGLSSEAGRPVATDYLEMKQPLRW